MTRSLCRACDEVFTSLGSFDAHQSEYYDRTAPPFVECHDPASTGKHRHTARGWALKATEGLAERLAAYRAPAEQTFEQNAPQEPADVAQAAR